MNAFDAAMAIFNNVPPRISFSELDVHLPCDSIYFELSSHAEMVHRSTFPKAKMKLIDAFQKLFIDPEELGPLMEKDSLNCWDMLLLIHCLYTYVWRQTFANPLLRTSSSTLFAPAAILDPLKLAIQNWKLIWDDIRSKLTREQMQGMGFETSADSYWTLTKLIVHRFDLNSNNSNGIENGNSTTTSNPAATTTFNVGGMQITVKDEKMKGMASSATGTGSDTPPLGGAEFVPAHATSLGNGGGWSALDFMPIDTDCESQGSHLRKILKAARR
jgi:hypothetical protein